MRLKHIRHGRAGMDTDEHYETHIDNLGAMAPSSISLTIDASLCLHEKNLSVMRIIISRAISAKCIIHKSRGLQV
jgi:hypothetical protein